MSRRAADTRCSCAIDRRRRSQGVGKVEFLMEVDHPVALADTVADFLAGFRHEPHALVRTENAADNRAADRRIDASTRKTR
jgi:hypothetical protein